MHHLGLTRSSLKADHLLQTPNTFVRTPLPGAEGVDFIVHAAPRLGAGLTQMTAEFSSGGVLGPAPAQRFLFVLEGELELRTESGDHVLNERGFGYLPEASVHTVRATRKTRAVVIEKPYAPVQGAERPHITVGNEADIADVPLMGDSALRVRALMPDGPAYDFAVNTMTYDPGAALSMVEIHVMEHGLLMLEGGGIYRLGDSWYPVEAGDFIWMAPYCPQWFGALGKQPAKYLIYKDWRRHPLSPILGA
ncbi:MAG TPA: (S)-ureidoglycine aminohydrolase [Candidatus Sulfopaludibacter sp.]|nr:(S)-ureidoglycine aminohydrolase [Candidatus Sulfopaludibacter sp.]